MTKSREVLFIQMLLVDDKIQIYAVKHLVFK